MGSDVKKMVECHHRCWEKYSRRYYLAPHVRRRNDTRYTGPVKLVAGGGGGTVHAGHCSEVPVVAFDKIWRSVGVYHNTMKLEYIKIKGDTRIV